MLGSGSSFGLSAATRRHSSAWISLEQTRKGEPIKPDLTLGAAALYFVGKHSTCAVQLEHPSVSRRHAVLLRDKVRGLLVVDLASKARAACAWAPS